MGALREGVGGGLTSEAFEAAVLARHPIPAHVDVWREFVDAFVRRYGTGGYFWDGRLPVRVTDLELANEWEQPPHRPDGRLW